MNLVLDITNLQVEELGIEPAIRLKVVESTLFNNQETRLILTKNHHCPQTGELFGDRDIRISVKTLNLLKLYKLQNLPYC